MDDLEEFQSISRNESALKAAALKAQKKLQGYYARTDQTTVYAVATAMDPSLKYQYWIDEEWEERFQNEAKAKVLSEWTKYKIVQQDEEEEPVTSDVHRNRYCPKRRRVQDELAAYLAEPVQTSDSLAPAENSDQTTPELLYWRRSAGTYMQLSRMARKFLAMPVTSTPCEWLFSNVKGFLTPERNRLQPEALEESVLLKSWLKI